MDEKYFYEHLHELIFYLEKNSVIEVHEKVNAMIEAGGWMKELFPGAEVKLSGEYRRWARDEEIYSEDDNPEPDKFLYDKNRFRDLYILEIIRRYILNAGKTLPYKMNILTAEGLLRVSFNLHPDYHGSLGERRIAFAQDTGFVTKSQKEIFSLIKANL